MRLERRVLVAGDHAQLGAGDAAVVGALTRLVTERLVEIRSVVERRLMGCDEGRIDLAVDTFL